jgi:hypothetical protein
MNELLAHVWGTQVRAGPVVVFVLAFAAINGLRRWFRFHYVPSYFVIFPVSLLDTDVARIVGTGPFAAPSTEAEKRKLKRAFIAKVTVAGLLTFVVIPLVLGILAAFYMTPPELAAGLAVLLVWQAYESYQSTLDNASHSQRPLGSRSLFAFFYLFYLASLGGFTHRGYVFARPFIQQDNFTGLASALWDIVFLVVIAGGIIGVLGNLMAYFITEREVL